MPADCVLYSPLLPQQDEVVRILESGKNVVTPVGWFYPFRAPGIAELEAACRKGGVSLHGTGIHPGGITELLPLTVSSLCRNIRHVRAEEFSDIRVYKAELVVREIMLFGKHARGSKGQPDARPARLRLRPVDRHGRGRARVCARRAQGDDARDGGGDGADRHARRHHRAGDGGGAALHLAGARWAASR